MTDLQWSAPPIFVIGVGRSGTSLVQSMLAAHSLLAVPPETAFLRRFVAPRLLSHTHRRGGPEAVEKLLDGDERVRRLGLDLADTLHGTNWQTRHLDRTIYETVMAGYATTVAKPRFGDKDPRLIEYLPVVSCLWPTAFVIHVVRDPRDVVSSRLKADWAKQRPYWVHALAYKVQMKLGRQAGPALFGARYVEVHYEALVARAEEELRKLCAAVHLDFEEGMLSFQESARRLVASSELQWKRETLGPVLTDNVGKWHGVLSPPAVKTVEAACPEMFESKEYQRTKSAAPRLRMRFLEWLYDGLAFFCEGWRSFALWRRRWRCEE
jgi:hypothetical protein